MQLHMTDSPFTNDQIEAGRKLFAAPVAFVKGVVDLQGLPKADRPEVAFAGRSNVGKSSLINALANRKNLARASNTPGRTQELNFFDLASGRAFLVDLPGYGFADAPKAHVDAWNRLMLDYLRHRANLKRVFLLIDSRRGIGPVDSDVLDLLDRSAVSYQVVLTKTDKIKASELASAIDAALAALKKRPAAHPRVIATSSEKNVGLEELRAEINGLALQG
jgi:GTP-binding protein